MNTWTPKILNYNDIIGINSLQDNLINNLINGKLSCIIIRNVLNNNDCKNIINHLVSNKVLDENLNYRNVNNFNFRKSELLTDIGLTIDNQKWIHTDMNLYWKETQKVNSYLNQLFNKDLNPIEIFFQTIKKISSTYFDVNLMKYKNYIGLKSIIRIHSPYNNTTFPYHTDGFNYGVFTNRGISDSIRNQIPVADKKFKTNVVCAVLLIIKQSKNKDNIELYNCLVDDLEKYKDKINGRSHRVGTKYGNITLLEKILKDKPFYKPLLNTGDLYIFSASRIHKLTKILGNKRIVLASFFTVDENKKQLILHQ
jgi:hypothetical protein